MGIARRWSPRWAEEVGLRPGKNLGVPHLDVHRRIPMVKPYQRALETRYPHFDNEEKQIVWSEAGTENDLKLVDQA